MKVRVDSTLCQGHNRCYALAPGLFQVDDYGYSTPRGDGKLTEATLPLARKAVENCPERAISIVEDDAE